MVFGFALDMKKKKKQVQSLIVNSTKREYTHYLSMLACDGLDKTRVRKRLDVCDHEFYDISLAFGFIMQVIII